MEISDKTINKVIEFYLSELSGGDFGGRFPEYDSAMDVFKAALPKDTDSEALERALDEIIALTEKLAFKDGFKAGATHTLELIKLASK